jgi:hypothetical protein
MPKILQFVHASLWRINGELPSIEGHFVAHHIGGNLYHLSIGGERLPNSSLCAARPIIGVQDFHYFEGAKVGLSPSCQVSWPSFILIPVDQQRATIEFALDSPPVGDSLWATFRTVNRRPDGSEIPYEWPDCSAAGAPSEECILGNWK